MRILIATGIYPPDIGGPATHSSDLREELAERGHEVHVLSYTDDLGAIHQPNLHRWPRAWAWPRRTWAVVRWIFENRHSFDVLYATGLAAPAVLGARLARRPVVVKVVGDPAWERSRRRGLTTSDFEDFRGGAWTGFRVAGMRSVRNWSLRRADAVVVPSEYLAEVVRGWVHGIDPVVIRNGVRIPSAISAPPRNHGAELATLFVGRLVAHKNVDVLIEAVRVTKGVSLRIVGDGPDRPRLESAVASAGLSDRVTFEGSLDRDAVLEHLTRSDALVTASGYEGLPHVAVEALCCGTPLVAPLVGGMKEVIEDSRNGLVVGDLDPGSFGQALARLRDDPVLRGSLARGAQQDAELWRFGRTADLLESLFTSLASSRPRAVFLAKTFVPAEPGPDLLRKFSILTRHLDPVLVNVGKGPTHPVQGLQLVTLPRVRPGFLGGLLFYSLGPIKAIRHAAGPKSAIVCQSPYEAAGSLFWAKFVPRGRRPRVIVEVHGDWRTASRLYGSPLRKIIAPLSDAIADRAVKRADRIRVIGDYTEDLVRQAGYLGETDRYIAFSDFGVFLADEPRPYPSEARVAFVGVFERYKGIDVLMRSWPLVLEKIPDASLELVGDGTLRSDIARAVERDGLTGSVTFRGRVPRSDVKDILDGSRVLVLPSRSEGLGLIALEAMARGRPVLASSVGGLSEVVRDGHNGICVPPGEPDELARALIDLLNDPEGAAEMGRMGRRAVEARDPLAEFESGIASLAAWIARD